MRKRERVQVSFDGPSGQSRTIRAGKDSADINFIVNRYKFEGVVSLNSRPGLFLDVSEMGDYRQAVEQVRQGQEFFGQLNSDIRARFKNDPAEFLDFVSDPSNREEMEKMGLLGEVPVKVVPEAPIDAPKGA